jgi:hypothetical protein
MIEYELSRNIVSEGSENGWAKFGHGDTITLHAMFDCDNLGHMKTLNDIVILLQQSIETHLKKAH